MQIKYTIKVMKSFTRLGCNSKTLDQNNAQR